MKRTRAVARIQQQNAIERSQSDEEATISPNVASNERVETERPRLNLNVLRTQSNKNVDGSANSNNKAFPKKSKNVFKEAKIETFIEKKEELKPSTKPGKGKLRAVVDLQMMKEELKQLEDPAVTPWEKKLSSSRLPFEFFNIPCEDLAQRLLGKVLVRYLENGTVLKGRIVETEGYLGAIDKASHSYQNKVTPRNLPMYMPPGTIYIYMTYGMYHCFNISSQEPNAHVLIRAMEPLMGLEYMELLRNMRRMDNGREKRIVKHIARLKRDPKDRLTIGKILGDGCAVLVRAVDPLEGVEYMTDQRNSSKSRKVILKLHEICNGPSKLCIAYDLYKRHSKYSICNWKGLWIEDDNASQDIKIVSSSRIGIDSCGMEWASKPLRYYIYGNKSVSKRDKKAEMGTS